MFYKFLKLTNGDNLIVSTDVDCNNLREQKTLSVVDPVLINTVKMLKGPYIVETFTMQPWIKLAKKDIIDIPTENIVVAVDIEDSVEEQYKSFLMDQVSTTPIVDDASEEDFQQLLEDYTDEFDDEYDEDSDDRDQRTLH